MAILSERLNTNWLRIHARITATHVARRMIEAFLRALSRVHLARFDQINSASSQANTLLGLVHRAQSTRFGLEHDFRRIRTEEDFRRLVPTTTSATLARSYGQTPDHPLAGSIWPEPLAGVASYETGEKNPQQVLLSPAGFAARRAALRAALAFVFHAHPFTQLLSGSLLFLGEPATVTQTKQGTGPGSPVETIRACLPRLWWPYSLVAACRPVRPPDGADDPLNVLAERCLSEPLTLACGSITELTHLFDRVKTLTQRDKITDVWSNLVAVLYSCRLPERGLLEPLRRELGPRVSLLEMGRFPEGIIAVEDPRHGLLRLLPNHGHYYEFIPAEETGKRTPQRLGLCQVQGGVPYEMALTSPGGVWACRVGAGVCFERLDPPLLRFIEPPRIETRPLPPDNIAEAAGLTVPGPHRRSGGSPAERPESFAHNPWLVPVDRG
jgi:hypothetical protein